MANYIAKARTNYFRVKDVAALVAELAEYGIEPGDMNRMGYGLDFALDRGENNKPEGAIAFFSAGAWPSLDEDTVAMRLDLEDDEPVPSKHDSLVELVGSHLIDGDVAIFMEIGSEKMRYFGGVAVAVNSKGEMRTVDLDDIYAVAKELTTEGHEITSATY